jgi:hypothetical protein
MASAYGIELNSRPCPRGIYDPRVIRAIAPALMASCV